MVAQRTLKFGPTARATLEGKAELAYVLSKLKCFAESSALCREVVEGVGFSLPVKPLCPLPASR